MSGLTFTDEAARHLEKTYRTEDIVAQRRETIRHLNLSTGEKVLDIGCGPGFLCEEMSEMVGRHELWSARPFAVHVLSHRLFPRF